MAKLFTPEELEEIRRADEEIEESFSLSAEDWKRSKQMDREARMEKLDNRGKKTAAKKAAYRKANKEKIAAQQAAYYEANKEKIAAQQAAYREANKEKIAARQAAYYEANKEKIAARQAAYYEANKEKIAAYREANRGKYNAYMRDYLRKKREAKKLSRQGDPGTAGGGIISDG